MFEAKSGSLSKLPDGDLTEGQDILRKLHRFHDRQGHKLSLRNDDLITFCQLQSKAGLLQEFFLLLSILHRDRHMRPYGFFLSDTFRIGIHKLLRSLRVFRTKEADRALRIPFLLEIVVFPDQSSCDPVLFLCDKSAEKSASEVLCQILPEVVLVDIPFRKFSDPHVLSTGRLYDLI